MKRMDGTALAAEVRSQLKQQIEHTGIHPGLGIIVVGDDSASALYIQKKREAAAEVGISVEVLAFPATTSKQELITAVQQLNANPAIHGIIVQLPLPRPEDTDEVIAAIAPQKDADGYHPQTLASLRSGTATIMPVMCRVVLALLEVYGPETETLATIVARNPNFAESLQLVLERNYVESQVVTPDAPDLALRVQEAGIVIAAGNTEKLITADMIQPGAVVIDIGIIRTAQGKTVGCVDFETVSHVASAITPVPGGVGPLTVAYLLQNVFDAAQRDANQ